MAMRTSVSIVLCVALTALMTWTAPTYVNAARSSDVQRIEKTADGQLPAAGGYKVLLELFKMSRYEACRKCVAQAAISTPCRPCNALCQPASSLARSGS